MTCNEWKEYSSMRIYAACTSLEMLQSLMSDGIRRDLFSYGGEDVSSEEQAQKFCEAWRNAMGTLEPEYELLRVCGDVKFAFVAAVTDGEPQQ